MKILLTLPFLIITYSFAQPKDIRSELEFNGGINEISISTDERIWLVSSTGYTYYSNHIDSNWHYGQELFPNNDEYSLNEPNLERISFFNKDTAIMTGYISANEKTHKKNGLYITFNGGRSWKLIDFGGDSWIYNTYVDKDGHAWMGGSSGNLFYSSDYGQHWIKLNSPYNSSSRMHYIFMSTSLEGIAGSLYNDIYSTVDNWKSSKKILTPFDQNKYKNIDRYSDDRIEKILIWNNFLVVNQNGHIFYSDRTKIDWQEFPIKAIDFELDKEANTLVVIGENMKVFSYSTPTEYQTLSDTRYSDRPVDMKIVNHNIYVLCQNQTIYMFNKSRQTRTYLYTTDRKISMNGIVKNGKNLKWGIYGKQVYISTDDNDWYREHVLDFNVFDYKLLNDSLAILWDRNNNYLFSLKDHKATIYFPENPLNGFLKSPIHSFSIQSGSHGCFHRFEDQISYKKIDDTLFITNGKKSNRTKTDDHGSLTQKINIQRLNSILKSIDSLPYALPTLSDFQITELDKKNYLEYISKNNTYDLNFELNISKEFYKTVPFMLDTLNDSIIHQIFNKSSYFFSTTTDWLSITIINENKETLKISRSTEGMTLPWNLPWIIEYNDLKFNCNSLEFSKFIKTCSSDDFFGMDHFDNKFLILEIAHYLFENQ